MDKIKNLYEGVNISMIPKSIYDKLVLLDNNKYLAPFPPLPPYPVKFEWELGLPIVLEFNDLGFHIFNLWWESFEKMIKSESGLFNEKKEKLTLKPESYNYLLVEFGKGFREGYFNFEYEIRQKSNVFVLNNSQIALYVYNCIDFSGGSKFNYGLSFLDVFVDPELMYRNGLEWGKQYKAWQIILNNIPLFEPLFDKSNKTNLTKKPQQETKTDAPPPPPPQKENQHQNIFISNGFDVWEEMFSKFQITEKSRTDVKFMFEIMKRDKMIHKSVSQKAYLEWINDVFEIDVQKTSNIDLKNTKNLSIYNTAKSMFIK